MGKGNNIEVWKYYMVEDDRIKRVRRECPRCGRGVFMAEHSDRVTCGRCNYTEFKRKDREKEKEGAGRGGGEVEGKGRKKQ
ncbi:MAG: 30S ribosomal protein S27ae [Candidatus Nitrosocaldus sp.]